MGTYRRFGYRLRQFRESRGVSAKYFSTEIRSSDTYILHIESGRKPPPDLDSAIGRRLYEQMGDQPTTHEMFLWAQWKAVAFSLRHLAFATLTEYYEKADPEDIESLRRHALDPHPLSSLLLPSELDADPIITELGGPSQTLGAAYDHLALVEAGTVVDWLLQSTYQLGFVFPPFVDERQAAEPNPDPNYRPDVSHPEPSPDQAMLLGSLRYPVRDIVSISVPLEL